MDIYIIGGGAAGLAAAISAGRQVTAALFDKKENNGAAGGTEDEKLAARGTGDVHIHILEKKEAAGRKLLATGNGRCNFTNYTCDHAKEILKFFYSIGVIARKEEEGRVYPYCGQASAVLAALERECARLGVEILTGITVDKIEVVQLERLGVSSKCMASGTARMNSLESQMTGGLNNVDSLKVSEFDIWNGDLNLPEDSSVGGQNSGFWIYATDAKGKKRKLKADKVLLATGGKAGAQFGCTGDGYKWAKGFGHTINTVFPVLTPIECAADMAALKGVRARGKAALYKNGKLLAEENGEIQFLEDGLSGICIFNLSRFLKKETSGECRSKSRAEGCGQPGNDSLSGRCRDKKESCLGNGSTGFENYEIRLDLAPDFNTSILWMVLKENPDSIESLVPKKLAEYLLRRIEKKLLKQEEYPERQLERGAAKQINNQAGRSDRESIGQSDSEPMIAKSYKNVTKKNSASFNIDENVKSTMCEGASLFKKTEYVENVDAMADRLAELLKCCTFRVKGAKGWKNAQVTAGGVALDEIDMNTMQSRKVKGLFFAGEIIDFDGPCGGYNLQNAWETGIKAGKAMAENAG